MSLPAIPDILKQADRTRKSEMSTVEQVVAHYVRGHKLSATVEAYRLLLEEAHKCLLAGKTRKYTAQYLIEAQNCQKSKAYQVINDALEVFGEVNRNGKEGLRYLQTEWYLKMSEKLEKENPELAIQCRQRIDKINGLEDKKGQTINIAKVLMPKQIIFTTDPAALALQRSQQEQEESDWEDAEEVEE
jgi:hypothetical protein